MPSDHTLPDEDQAYQFAVMLRAGLPASEAILYFIDETDPAVIAVLITKWQRSKAVKKATLALLGKPWQELTTEERMQTALDLHYSQLATFLYMHNYLEVGSAEKAKADTARVAIEARLHGTAGQADPLTKFFEDLRSGRLKLAGNPLPAIAAPGSTH